MPELPEVETVVRGLNRLIVKKKITAVRHDWPKSFPNSPSSVDVFMIGSESKQVRRRAKVIIVDLTSDYCLVVPLIMTGPMV